MRIPWIDIARGLGILCVIFGHIYLIDGARFVYLFHMPLFFILSGFVFRPAAVREFAFARLVSLGLPYLLYLAVFGLPFQLLSVWHEVRLGGHAGPLLVQALVDLAYGGQRLKGALTAFWFIPVFCMALVAYPMFVRWVGERRPLLGMVLLLSVATVSAAMIRLLPAYANPLDIWVVPIAVFFLLVGRVLRPNLAVNPTWTFGLAGCVSLAGLGSAIAWPDAMAIDLKFGIIGVPVVSMAVAIALSMMVIGLAQLVDPVPWIGGALRHLGRSSLTIMYIHPVVIFVAAMVNGQVPDLLSRPVIFGLALGISLLAQAIYERSPLLSRLFLAKHMVQSRLS